MPVRFRSFASACQLLIVGSLTAACLLVPGRPGLAEAQGKQSEAAAKAGSSADLIARGRYLVEDVAACAQCHTPRDKNGEPDHTRWLEGAPVFLQPAQAVPGWAIVAPRLSGLPPGSDAAIITLLTTGIWTNGKPPRQPMPRFHMTRSDAEAVVAYLKSL